MIERGGGESLTLGFRQSAEAARDGSAHAGTVETGGKSGDEGGSGGHFLGCSYWLFVMRH